MYIMAIKCRDQRPIDAFIRITENEVAALAKSVKEDGRGNEEWLFVIDEKCLPLRVITSEVTQEQIVVRIENWIKEYRTVTACENPPPSTEASPVVSVMVHQFCGGCGHRFFKFPKVTVDRASHISRGLRCDLCIDEAATEKKVAD